MSINPDFKCLPVTLLFHTAYYDGPLSGLCEYNGEKLYFQSTEELMFKFPEKDPEILASGDEDDKHDYHRLRIYTLYKLPEDLIKKIIFNHDLFERLKRSPVWAAEYEKEKQELPSYFTSHEEFAKVSWQYAYGYTTEDVWDNKEWLRERHKQLG